MSAGSAIPDRDPELSLEVRDIRKINFSALGVSYSLANATADDIVSVEPHNHPHLINQLQGSIVASWDTLVVTVLPRFGLAHAVYTVHLAWGHSDHPAPADLEQLSQLPGYQEFVFGSLSASIAIPPPVMKTSCPFTGGIGRQSKPKDLMGGRPKLFLRVSAHSFSGAPTTPPTSSVVQVHLSGVLSVKGNDFIIT